MGSESTTCQNNKQKIRELPVDGRYETNNMKKIDKQDVISTAKKSEN